jgi:CheY-like chemotaxis protein
MKRNDEKLSMKNHKVLLVEDDINDVILIRRAFKKANMIEPIQIVENGEDAIDYLAGTGKFRDRKIYPLPSLILLDLKLPRKSGHEVLNWVKKQPKIKRIPIVVISSSKRSPDINRAYDLGANSYMLKPISFGVLLKKIKEIDKYWFALNERPEINSRGEQ